MIDSYLTQVTELDDHAIHLLFSANRWEKRSVNLNHIHLTFFAFSPFPPFFPFLRSTRLSNNKKKKEKFYLGDFEIVCLSLIDELELTFDFEYDFFFFFD